MMRSRAPVAAVMWLLAVAAPAQSPPLPLDFSTEAQAIAALERVLRRVDSAIPTLTPDQHAYLKREQAYVDETFDPRNGADTPNNRRDAFYFSKEYRLQRARMDLGMLQRALQRVNEARGKQYRFVAWTEIVVALGRVQQWESSLEGLLSHGALSKSDLGVAEGVNWLAGPSDGQVQMLWGFWADVMWDQFVHDGLTDLARSGSNAKD